MSRGAMQTSITGDIVEDRTKTTARQTTIRDRINSYLTLLPGRSRSPVDAAQVEFGSGAPVLLVGNDVHVRQIDDQRFELTRIVVGDAAAATIMANTAARAAGTLELSESLDADGWRARFEAMKQAVQTAHPAEPAEA